MAAWGTWKVDQQDEFPKGVCKNTRIVEAGCQLALKWFWYFGKQRKKVEGGLGLAAFLSLAKMAGCNAGEKRSRCRWYHRYGS
jgi:hypothetical protein